jgi:hypothetical protein
LQPIASDFALIVKLGMITERGLPTARSTRWNGLCFGRSPTAASPVEAAILPTAASPPEASMQCTMAVLAGPADIEYFRHITAHLKRTAHFQFSETLLVLDTMQRRKSEALVAAARAMQAANEIDRYVELEPHMNIMLAHKHFTQPPKRLRDNRGIPLFGWIAGMENATTDYLFHSDSDILIHSAANFSWVKAAIDVMENDPSIMFVAPLAGPPNPRGLVGQKVAPIIDEAGNYRFKTFSSRHYVVNRRRFEKLLPLRPLHASEWRKLVMTLGGSSSLRTWEKHVGLALASSAFFRIHLSDPRAWGLHCKDHGPPWRENLPSIMAAVERGDFPRSQAGYYNLRLEDWLKTGWT